MKRIALTSAIVLGLAAPAFAGSQLENSLGVDAGTYSVSQLAQLKDAAEKTDNEGRIFFADAMGMSTKGTFSHGANTQLQSAAGVDASGYTVGQLALLKDAAEKTDNEGRIVLSSNAPTVESQARIAAFIAQVAEESRDNN